MKDHLRFKSLNILSLEEYLNIFDQLKNRSNRRRHWAYLIRTNQLTCPVTKKLVSYCSYDYKDNTKSFHYNFYSEDGTFMSIDHKTPISQGGSKTNPKNVQPMAIEENFKKSNNLIYL